MKRHKTRLTLICSKQSPQFCMLMDDDDDDDDCAKQEINNMQRKKFWRNIGKDVDTQLCISLYVEYRMRH